ncbi:MAG: HU family DNA-binding protein, partial [Muribaculaceae bacterium]|nr:HU family DNA-binding protein [Muribaculaceae bacterium]
AFLTEFFKLISESLRKGESVKIKALGTFKLMNVETRKSVNVANGEEITIPEHTRIVFVPSREIAEVVNSPFSMFESVELHPDAEKEIEGFPDAAVEQEEESGQKAEAAPTEPKEEVEEQKVESEVKDSQEEIESASPDTDEDSTEPSPDITEEATIEESNKGKSRMRFALGFVSGIVVALLIFALGYWYVIHKDGNALLNREVSATNNVVENDSVAALAEAGSDTSSGAIADSLGALPQLSEEEKLEAASEIPDTHPSDSEPKVIKDVIGPHNYLTTMAQRHYGDFNLWAYIYEENKSFLGHPDRIKPGTEVVVPPLSKYGVDPKNPQDVLKAKRLGMEIYNRFK